MPFQSDRQKRWMYANEPEIAREWSDRYGAANGGIMDVASDGNLIDEFKNYNKGESVNVPTSFQARSHSTPVNLAYITDDEAGILQALKPDTPHDGPMGIPNYDDWDPDRGYTSGTAMSAMETGSTNPADRREVRVSNYGGPTGMAPGAKTKREQEIRGGAQAAAAMGQRRSGMGGWGGNILRGIMSIFGGAPGKVLSLLSRFNPDKINKWQGDWREKNLGFRTQKEWEDARTDRRNKKNIERILNRTKPITAFAQKRLEDLGYTGEMPSIGSTGALRKGNELTLFDDKPLSINPEHYNDLGNELMLSTQADDMNYNEHYTPDSGVPFGEEQVDIEQGFTGVGGDPSELTDMNEGFIDQGGGITNLENEIQPNNILANAYFASTQQHLPGLGPNVNTGDPYKDNIYRPKKRLA